MSNWIGLVQLPESVKDEIVRLYLRGDSHVTVGKKFDRSGPTVARVLEERGVKTRRMGEYRLGRRTGDPLPQKEQEKRKVRQAETIRRINRANQERRTLYSVRGRCKKKGLPFDISVGDIEFPAYCPVLGIKLERNEGRTGPCDNSPTYDRIVPSRGYVKGNVRVISNKANRIKNNATVEELELVLADLKKITAYDAAGEGG